MENLRVRAATPADRRPVANVLAASWGDTSIMVHGAVYDAVELPALVAEHGGRLVGVLTYAVSEQGLEVVSLDAMVRRIGVGSALLATAARIARRIGVHRLWLVTTNDNIDALRFYQRRGMRIVGITPGGVDAARAVKPSIPLVGEYGIALHDELTLELRL